MAFTTPPTLELFIKGIVASELITESEIAEFMDQRTSHKPLETSAQLAYELVRCGHLTKYQAQVLYQGRKSRPLVLGNYIVLERLGSGGMGQVFKAKHRVMDRLVALKMLPTGYKEDAVKRFHREVKAAARLIHPNIVTAYDADFAKGCHFLVMEFVDGMNLSQFVKEHGPFPPDQAAACIVQAARGLAYAHSMGVIHRDIKPSNLLLDSHGIVKVLDMGLARIEETMELDARMDDLTQAGSVMGSVDYMPPEQGMDMRQTNQLSDIYSLGGTLYFLVVGHPMYGGKTVVERIMAHRDRVIPTLRDGNAAVPTKLDRFYQRMVAKDPAQRPQSMDDVIANIESIFLSSNVGEEEEETRLEETVSISAHAIPGVAQPGPSVPESGEGTGASLSNSLLDEWIMDDISSTSAKIASGPPMRLGGYSSYRRRERQLYWLVGFVAIIAMVVVLGVLISDLVKHLNSDTPVVGHGAAVVDAGRDVPGNETSEGNVSGRDVVLATLKVTVSESDATLRIVDMKSNEKISEQKLFGRNEFETQLPEGRYRIEVEKPGFTPYQEDLGDLMGTREVDVILTLSEENA